MPIEDKELTRLLSLQDLSGVFLTPGNNEAKRWKARGYVAINAGYIHKDTDAELRWLQHAWGLSSRSKVIDIAVRRLYQQTRQGLKRLDFEE